MVNFMNMNPNLQHLTLEKNFNNNALKIYFYS